MPRFHFHIRSDIEAKDPEGCEFQDLAAAEQRALQSARILVSDEIARSGNISLNHAIEITDPAGALLRTVPFSAAVTIRR